MEEARDRGEIKSYSIYMKFQKKQNYSTDGEKHQNSCF